MSGRTAITGTRVAAYGDGDLVLVDQVDGEHGIFTVTLNTPDAFNVLDPPMMVALTSAWDELTAKAAADPGGEEIRVVIFRAAGRAFCAGVDIGNLGDYFDEGFNRQADPFTAMAECPLPIVGAVNGPAVTGGFELTLRCDVLVASGNALFMDNHPKYNLHPVGGLSWRLAKIVGFNNAKLATLASYPVDARMALNWGLVQKLVDDAEALEREALTFARLISANHNVMARRYKQIHEQHMQVGDGPAVEAQSDASYYPLLPDLKAAVDDGADKFRAFMRWVEERDVTGPDGVRTSA